MIKIRCASVGFDTPGIVEFEMAQASQGVEKAPNIFVIPSGARNLSFFSWA
jgi:hypothetical protein